MKDLLIIFIILLVLLLLISTFGGSLRYNNIAQEVVGIEKYESHIENEEEMPKKYIHEMPRKDEIFKSSTEINPYDSADVFQSLS